jgi:hypothetical protein
MAVAQELIKRSAETVRFDIDCSPILAVDETIQTILSAADDAGALVLSGASTNPEEVRYAAPLARRVRARQVIQLLVAGGVAGTAYVVRVRFTTSTVGELREATVTVRVIDSPSAGSGL